MASNQASCSLQYKNNSKYEEEFALAVNKSFVLPDQNGQSEAKADWFRDGFSLGVSLEFTIRQRR